MARRYISPAERRRRRAYQRRYYRRRRTGSALSLIFLFLALAALGWVMQKCECAAATLGCVETTPTPAPSLIIHTVAPSHTIKATAAPTPTPVSTEAPTPTPTPFYLYYDQNNKDAVMELQSRLIELNYYDGEATGRFDWKTRQAITDFQEVNWMAQTGEADQNTLNRIFGACVPNYVVYVTGDGSYHTTIRCPEVKNFKAMTIAQAMKQRYLFHDCNKE